jgi:hypothetical protein
MTRPGALLRGALVGAAATYFFDPDVGRRRRALVRDRIVHWLAVVRQELESELHDLRNRTRGAVASVRRIGAAPKSSDEAIAGRIRARLRSLEHPGAVRVAVREGRVHLAGPVLPRDAERARRIVRHVRGAQELVDELEVHQEPDVPALRDRPRGVIEREPLARLAVGLLTMGAASPVARRMGTGTTARLLALWALGAAVASAERARVRAVAHARDPGGDTELPL